MSDELADWRATLPPRYAHKVMGALRQVLAAGVRWRLLERRTRPSTPARTRSPRRAPVRAYTRRRARRDRRRARRRYRSLPAFGAATGLRPEEWAALERRHVDRARRLVRVEQKNVDGDDRARRQDHEQRPRGAAHRAVRSPRSTRCRRGSTRRSLFPAPEGGPLNLDNFRRREWSPAVEAAGVAEAGDALRPARHVRLERARTPA